MCCVWKDKLFFLKLCQDFRALFVTCAVQKKKNAVKKNMGFSLLTMQEHKYTWHENANVITTVHGECFHTTFQLRHYQTQARNIPTPQLEMMASAFVSLGLCYCNSRFTCVGKSVACCSICCCTWRPCWAHAGFCAWRSTGSLGLAGLGGPRRSRVSACPAVASQIWHFEPVLCGQCRYIY